MKEFLKIRINVFLVLCIFKLITMKFYEILFFIILTFIYFFIKWYNDFTVTLSAFLLTRGKLYCYTHLLKLVFQIFTKYLEICQELFRILLVYFNFSYFNFILFTEQLYRNKYWRDKLMNIYVISKIIYIKW